MKILHVTIQTGHISRIPDYSEDVIRPIRESIAGTGKLPDPLAAEGWSIHWLDAELGPSVEAFVVAWDGIDLATNLICADDSTANAAWIAAQRSAEIMWRSQVPMRAHRPATTPWLATIVQPLFPSDLVKVRDALLRVAAVEQLIAAAMLLPNPSAADAPQEVS